MPFDVLMPSLDDDFRALLDRHLDPVVRLHAAPPAPDAEALVMGRPTRELLEEHPRLRTLIIPFAGLPRTTRTLLADFPDLAVHNIHHNDTPTAEMALALMLAVSKRLVPIDARLRKGDWTPRYDRDRSLLLAGRTALVIGHGAIGRAIAQRCSAFDMDVVAIRRGQGDAVHSHPYAVRSVAELETYLPRADVCFVAVPETEETIGLLGASELALLPEHATVINVARGPVIDEQAFYEALRDGRLGGAGIDVWYEYPADRESRSSTAPSRFDFAALDNVVMSPHRAGHCDRTEERRAEHLSVVLNALACGGDVPHAVDPARAY